MVSILIIIQGLCAFGSALMINIYLPIDSNDLDHILAAIGVLFVHELEEKMYQIVNKASKITKIVFLTVFVIVVAAGAVAAQSLE